MANSKRQLIGLAVGTLVIAGLFAFLYVEFTSDPDPKDEGQFSGAGDGATVESAGGEISGRVVDGHRDQPVPGARLKLVCPDEADRQTTSNGTGGFGFEDLPSADCALFAHADGYLAGGRSKEVVLQVGVEAGSVLTDLEVVLYQSGRVSGRVLAGDRPVGGARLSVYYLEAPGETGPYSLDLAHLGGADGSYVADGLGPGRIRMIAEAQGFALAESREVFLKSGDQVVDLDIQLEAGASVAGVVVDPGRKPLAGAQVRLFASGSQRPRLVRTDEEGRFLYERVRPGAFRVAARAPGYRTVRLDTEELEAGQTSELEIVLEPVAGIAGRVEDAQGRPVSSAAIHVSIPEEDGGSGEQGSMASRSGLEGDFWVAGPFESQRVSIWAGHPRYGISQVSVVDPASETEVVLRLAGTGKLQGLVLQADGQPVTRFQVLADRDRTAKADARSGAGFAFERAREASGRFRFEQMAPGTYTIEVQATGYTPIRKAGLRVVAGSTTDAGTLYLSAGGNLIGRVVDSKSDQPLANAQVRVAGSGRVYPRTVSGQDGTFRLVGVPAQRLSLYVSANRYVTRLVSGVEPPSEGELDLGTIRLDSSAGRRGGMNYAGMGAMLKVQDDGSLTVEQLFDGAPASAAGLSEGTRILRIDGMDVGDLGMWRAVELIRGEAGTEVSLDVIQPGDDHPQTIRVERDNVESPD